MTTPQEARAVAQWLRADFEGNAIEEAADMLTAYADKRPNGGNCGAKHMSNVRKLEALPALPPDLPVRLREMADDVEARRVTAMIVGYVCEGSYEFLWPSSLNDSLTIATLAQASALDRMRR